MARAPAFTTRVERADRVRERLEAGPVAVPHFAVAFAATPFAGIEERGGDHPCGIVNHDACPTRKRVTRINA